MRHVFDTPAGPVELVCQVDGLEPSLYSVKRLAAGVRETWVSPGRLEVIFLRTELGPPRRREDRPPLDGYVGVVWTLSAAVECGPLRFSAHLTDPAVRKDSAPNTGAHVSAVTWFAVDTDPGWILSAAGEVRAGPARPQHGAGDDPPSVGGGERTHRF